MEFKDTTLEDTGEFSGVCRLKEIFCRGVRRFFGERSEGKTSSRRNAVVIVDRLHRH
jgi:hypothetical protein